MIATSIAATMANKGLKNLLFFSRKERSALLILIMLVILFFLAPYFFPKKKPAFAVRDRMPSKASSTKEAGAPVLFLFDPNTIDSVGWKRLGLPDKTIQTIIHYREKGGRFRTAEDIKKIYGLDIEEAEILIPYVQIGKENSRIVSSKFYNSNRSKNYTFPLEINKAGVDHWAALPGISSTIAQRIVHYRDAIDGFKTIDQVGKTYGISPSRFNAIKPFLRLTKEVELNTSFFQNAEPSVLTEKQAVASLPNKFSIAEKININTATEQELMSQKRIPRNIAKAIIIYRDQHGQYQDVSDIKNIVFINDEMYQKVVPYLKVE